MSRASRSSIGSALKMPSLQAMTRKHGFENLKPTQFSLQTACQARTSLRTWAGGGSVLKPLEMPIHVQRLSLAPMHCFDQETRIYQHKEKDIDFSWVLAESTHKLNSKISLQVQGGSEYLSAGRRGRSWCPRLQLSWNNPGLLPLTYQPHLIWPTGKSNLTC